jgi:hypothetical protein
MRPLTAGKMDHDGLFETGIVGVKIFRATQGMPCAPAIYEPSFIAIVSGSKEAILRGRPLVRAT